jgi:CheY-like chemotaxis protein
MPAIRQGGDESVLLVEDDPILRKVIARSLGSLGYEVRVAATGTEASEILLASVDELDLMLTDMVLPGLSGADLARQALDLSDELRVLFVSGYGDLELAEELRSTGRVSFLPKPFSPPELASKVRDVLDGDD